MLCSFRSFTRFFSLSLSFSLPLSALHKLRFDDLDLDEGSEIDMEAPGPCRAFEAGEVDSMISTFFGGHSARSR